MFVDFIIIIEDINFSYSTNTAIAVAVVFAVAICFMTDASHTNFERLSHQNLSFT